MWWAVGTFREMLAEAFGGSSIMRAVEIGKIQKKSSVRLKVEGRLDFLHLLVSLDCMRMRRTKVSGASAESFLKDRP
jgi:hypothetical protein